MMKAFIKISVIVLFATMVLTQTVVGFDFEYIGTIEENLHSPTSLSISNDRLAVLEPYANQIKLFTPDGIITQKIDVTGDIHALVRYLGQSYLFCNRADNSIILIDLENGEQFRLFSDAEIIKEPVDLIYQDSTLYILDAGRASILVYDNQLILTSETPLLDSSGNRMTGITGFDRDSKTGQFYLLSQLDSRIVIINSDGAIINSLSSFGGGDGQLTRGGELVVTPGGFVLVTDRYQGNVIIFDPEGQFVGNIGAETGFPLDVPTGIAVDQDGLIYVSSTMNAEIKIFYANLKLENNSAVTTSYPIYPEDGAEVSQSQVVLKAYVEATDAATQVAGFQFQLFDSGNQNEPLELSDLRPDSTIMTDGSIQKVMAVWSPTTRFTEENEYFWNSRVMVKGQYGSWSDLRSFKISALPGQFSLDQNFPNPFNPTTTINFSLPRESDVTLEVINILGERTRVIVSDRLPAGNHSITWDGRDENSRMAASGIYFYRLRTEQYEKTRKMVLLK